MEQAWTRGGAALLLAGAVSAQGGVDDSGKSTGYLNFESPQVKPIDVAWIGNRSYVLACNTAAGTVEVRYASDLQLDQVIPVGQEPVSVVWVADQNAFYTADFIGDSVTKVELLPDPLAQRTRYGEITTRQVADEPVHLAAVDDGKDEWLVVSLLSRSSAAILDADDLADAGEVLLIDGPIEAAATHALKEPRTVLVDGTTVQVLASRDVNTDSVNDGFGLFTGVFTPLSSPPLSYVSHVDKLGTTVFNAARDADDVYVVTGTRPEELHPHYSPPSGEVVVAHEPLGFVRSMLLRIPAGAPLEGRDLNTDAAGDPVGLDEAVCQPTDVVLQTGAGGLAERAFVASFGTDRVLVIDDLAQSPQDWTIDRVEVSPLHPEPDAVAGPRGLALDTQTAGDEALFVLNRIDGSIAKISLGALTVVAQEPLVNDPTPAYVRLGRRFLYDGRLSGSGFVSCASCHVDGRLDGLVWDLGDPGNGGGDGQTGLAEEIVEGIESADQADEAKATLFTTGFPLDKGGMVTQSLQGLVNWETDPGTQDWVTNAPYHWRGDRADFLAFQGAFLSLLLGTTDESTGRAVGSEEMLAFERFVNSIAYPPNPLQDDRRLFEGEALEGLERFLTVPYGDPGTRSCVHCHALPEGSNNKVALMFGFGPPFRFVETAALRAGERKNGLYVEPDGTITDLELVGGGTSHDPDQGQGSQISKTIEGFAAQMFTDVGVPGATFIRQMDTGTAPAVGLSFTVDSGHLTQAQSYSLALFLQQADAGNVGLAVHGFHDGRTVEGFWYDTSVAAGAPPFRREPTGDYFQFQDLLDRVGNRADPLTALFVACTPLGNERRLSRPDLSLAPLGGPPPLIDQLETMSPDTAYEPVPTYTENWADFDWSGDPNPGSIGSRPQTLKRTVHMQQILQGTGFLPDPGGIRHDAPRRFWVRGSNIRHGAVLEIELGGLGGVKLRAPLFSMRHPDDGTTIWTTAVEFDPHDYYMFMLGGPNGPGVADLLDDVFEGYDTIPPSFYLPGPAQIFDPPNANKHLVRVINADGSQGVLADQPITLR